MFEIHPIESKYQTYPCYGGSDKIKAIMTDIKPERADEFVNTADSSKVIKTNNPSKIKDLIMFFYENSYDKEKMNFWRRAENKLLRFCILISSPKDLIEDNTVAIMAKNNDKLLGGCLLAFDRHWLYGKTVECSSLSTEKSIHGKKEGVKVLKQLAVALYNMCKEDGIDTIIWHAEKNNKTAVNLYKHISDPLITRDLKCNHYRISLAELKKFLVKRKFLNEES